MTKLPYTFKQLEQQIKGGKKPSLGELIDWVKYIMARHISDQSKIDNLIHFWMYEVSPIIVESRLLGSNNIVDAAVVGIPNKENGEVSSLFHYVISFEMIMQVFLT